MDVFIGDYTCNIKSCNNNQIICDTSVAYKLHSITNDAEHPGINRLIFFKYIDKQKKVPPKNFSCLNKIYFEINLMKNLKN